MLRPENLRKICTHPRSPGDCPHWGCISADPLVRRETRRCVAPRSRGSHRRCLRGCKRLLDRVPGPPPTGPNHVFGNTRTLVRMNLSRSSPHTDPQNLPRTVLPLNKRRNHPHHPLARKSPHLDRSHRCTRREREVRPVRTRLTTVPTCLKQKSCNKPRVQADSGRYGDCTNELSHSLFLESSHPKSRSHIYMLTQINIFDIRIQSFFAGGPLAEV